MLKRYRLRMNMKAPFIILWFALFFLWPSIAVGERWVLLGENDACAFYIDVGSVKLVSDTSSKAWIKVVPKTQELKEDILKSRTEQGLDVKGYENFAYRMESVEVQCALEKHRILETSDYDGTDRKIGASFPISEWKQTQPDTFYYSFAKGICEEHSTEGYWWWDYKDHDSHDEE
ncbi:MAG: surface-adhesin E family protein [Syntrophales bacterium]